MLKSIKFPIQNIKDTKLFFVSGIALLFIFLFPYIYLGIGSYLTIHDNLDSEFVFLHLLKSTGLLFGFDGNTIVPNVMNGIPRSFFHSEFSFIRLLFLIFPSFWAYVINSVLIRMIGFMGMYLFAKDYLMKGSNTKAIIAISALFSFIPIYSVYGLSVMGQPILIWAFLNLCYNHRSILNWLIISAFPFYAHIAMIAPFIVAALSIYGIYRFTNKNLTINKSYFIGLGILICGFLIANIITLKSFIWPGDYISHRSAWVAEPYSIKNALIDFYTIFAKGQYHSSSFTALPIYLFALVTFFIVKNDLKKIKILALPIVIIGIISLFAATYPIICFKMQNFSHILLSFQFSRIEFLIPVLWFIILGISVQYTFQKLHPVIIPSFLIVQFLFIAWQNEELRYNYAKTIFAKEYAEKIPGFKSFYAAELFGEVATFINKPKSEYRVVSLGMFPSIAQYNGFYTLDSYQNNYPLKYKQEFREIIASELNKNNELRQYYDDWGSRCYLFSAELRNTCNLTCSKKCGSRADSLDINSSALKKMGGEYIFSAVPIINYEQLQLNFLKKFSDINSEWDIYLYKIL